MLRIMAAPAELVPHIGSSSVRPVNTCASNGSCADVFRLASMNLGWQISSKRHTASWLRTAVEDVIQARAPDALGLREMFEVDNSEVAIVRKQNLLQITLG